MAWLKRGQRAQPDLAPWSGSPGSLEWSELPDGWQVTVYCRSCECTMSAKVRPWWESHRHLKLCGWTLSSDAYWYCRSHAAASVTFADRLLARDPLLGRCFYQKSLAHAKKASGRMSGCFYSLRSSIDVSVAHLHKHGHVGLSGPLILVSFSLSQAERRTLKRHPIALLLIFFISLSDSSPLTIALLLF